MDFFYEAITTLQTSVIAIGAGLGVWGIINLMEGNIYPLIHAIYYVDTVEIVEIEKQYKQECV